MAVPVVLAPLLAQAARLAVPAALAANNIVRLAPAVAVAPAVVETVAAGGLVSGGLLLGGLALLAVGGLLLWNYLTQRKTASAPAGPGTIDFGSIVDFTVKETETFKVRRSTQYYTNNEAYMYDAYTTVTEHTRNFTGSSLTYRHEYDYNFNYNGGGIDRIDVAKAGPYGTYINSAGVVATLGRGNNETEWVSTSRSEYRNTKLEITSVKVAGVEKFIGSTIADPAAFVPVVPQPGIAETVVLIDVLPIDPTRPPEEPKAPPLTIPGTAPGTPSQPIQPVVPVVPQVPGPAPFRPGQQSRGAQQPGASPARGPVKFPTSNPGQPALQFDPTGAPVAQARPKPTTTPVDQLVIAGTTIGAPAARPRPTIAGVAQELGKLEQKIEALMNRPSGGGPGGDLTDLIQLLLSLIGEPYEGGQFELTSPCEKNEDGTPKDALVSSWGGGTGRFNELASQVGALAELLQFSKNLKQPICAKRPPRGTPYTVTFEEVPPSS